jgi:hypothetical protein
MIINTKGSYKMSNLKPTPNKHSQNLDPEQIVRQLDQHDRILIKILLDPVKIWERYNLPKIKDSIGTTNLITILSKSLPDWDQTLIETSWEKLYQLKLIQTPMSDLSVNIHKSEPDQLENRLTPFGMEVALSIK